MICKPRSSHCSILNLALIWRLEHDSLFRVLRVLHNESFLPSSLAGFYWRHLLRLHDELGRHLNLYFLIWHWWRLFAALNVKNGTLCWHVGLKLGVEHHCTKLTNKYLSRAWRRCLHWRWACCLLLLLTCFFHDPIWTTALDFNFLTNWNGRSHIDEVAWFTWAWEMILGNIVMLTRWDNFLMDWSHRFRRYVAIYRSRLILNHLCGWRCRRIAAMMMAMISNNHRIALDSLNTRWEWLLHWFLIFIFNLG